MDPNQQTPTHQILIKLLNGKHKTLNLQSPIIPIQTLKHHIQTLTSIPSDLQLLTLSSSRILHDHDTLHLPSSGHHQTPLKNNNNDYPSGSLDKDDNYSYFPVVVNLLLRLRGGKGGFGSLLRGAATKAGQKKTNNFDACRDMSGRRLRHVNAEKKLEEWKAEAEERKLEKVAEEYLKKQAKELGKKAKTGKGFEAEKYVAKYREDSAKCMEKVERTVRESLKGVLASKRKSGCAEVSESEAKRMKIWLGKRTTDSDSEDMDEDDSDDDEDEENEKSVVIDNEHNLDSKKEVERSPDSVTGAKVYIVSYDKGTSDSGSEQEKNVVAEVSPKSDESSDGDAVRVEAKNVTGIEMGSSEEDEVQNGVELCLDAPVLSVAESLSEEKEVAKDPSSGNSQETVCESPATSVSGEQESSPAQGSAEKTVSTKPEVADLEKPLIFDDFNSSAELEVLGMERLKSELQERGLKCGGTLQERAARLFLLKTTPLEKLPKKLFAKK